MKDVYIVRKQGIISAHEGKREGSERRFQNERRTKTRHDTASDKQENFRKNHRRTFPGNRRIGIKMTDRECFAGRVGAMSVSVLFAVIGTLFFITGVTFLPYFGVMFGALAFYGSFFFLFTRNKHHQGLLQ